MTRRKLSLHSLILSIVLLLSLLVSVTLFNSKSIHANNTITVGDTDFDLDNLESYQVGESTEVPDATGLTYTFYDNGLCTITGEQKYNRGFSDNPLKNNTDVLVVYANYKPNCKDQIHMFSYCKAHAIVFGPDFNMKNVTDNTKTVIDMRYMFLSCGNLKVLKGLKVSKFDTDIHIDMSYMFQYCKNLKDLDLSEFDTTNVTDMRCMFEDCSSLTSLDVSKFVTTNVTDMHSMFNGCSSLTSLVVSEFVTTNVTDMGFMFDGCSSLTSLDVSKFDTTNVTNMSYMFNECSSLTVLDVSNFVTTNETNMSGVTNMSGMFQGCSGLTALDVSNFNTEYVTEMSTMFNGCSSLTSLDVSKFDTTNVTNMVFMFCGCSSLGALDVSNFNTEKVENMSYMFYGCSSLTELDVSNFDTKNVTDMNLMFYDCSSLETLDVSNFNTEKVTYMEGMFGKCSSLKNVDVSSFNTSQVVMIDEMFYECSSLKELDLSNFDVSSCYALYGLVDGCSNLEILNISNKFVIDSNVIVLMESHELPNEFYDKEEVKKFLNEEMTDDEFNALINIEDYYIIKNLGFARDCPKLSTIIIDNNYNGFKSDNFAITKYVAENFDICQSFVGFDSADKFGPGRLFYTDKVNDENVPLNFVVLGDTITNPLVENLGTELDPYDYDNDNRTISVIRANDLLSETKNDLKTKNYINDKNVNKEVYDKYQDLNISDKAILKSDPTIVKDTKTYKDLINDLIDAYNDFNKPSPEPEPEPKPKKTITTSQTITVEYVNVDKAYMNGYDDKTFRPNENITRAELSAVFSRLLNNDIDKEDYTKYSAKYNDLSLNWYHNYIGYLTNRNIFDGYNDNTFKPQNSMTKAEFAKSIVKMFNVKMNKSNNVDNKEIDGRWYKDYLDIMISNYYIDSNYIKTCNEPITRKEVCYIVNVAKGRKVKTKETLTKEESDYIKNNYKDLNENDPYYYHIVSALLDMK